MQGFFSALELVPMWSGVDHDVEIFASGVVTEDDGDWGTTEGTKEQAGAAAGEKCVGHVRGGGGCGGGWCRLGHN